MSLTLSPSTEARLIAKAQELGISVDALLESLIPQTPPSLKKPGERKNWICRVGLSE